MSEFIKPPRELIDKTGPGTSGGGSAVIKKADTALKQYLAETNYGAIAAESLNRLDVLWSQLSENPADPALMKEIYEIAHNLRGEGASFGYPAVSEVAELICRIAQQPTLRTKRQLKVIEVEIQALKAMVRYNIKGAPQGLAHEVVKALATLVDAVLGVFSQRL